MTLAPAMGLAALGGCSAPDPGEVHFVKRPPTSPGQGSGDTDVDGGLGGGGGGGGGGTTTDGGTTTTGDGGTVVVADNAFKGAPAFVQQTGPSTIQAQHNFNGSQNPQNQNCMDCHDTGGAAATKFAGGGTIYKDLAGTMPAGSVEVVVRKANNAGFIVAHTDNNGNFFIPAAQGPITAGSMSGVRDGTANGTSPMAGLLGAGASGGGCNQGGTCHGGAQGKIHVP